MRVPAATSAAACLATLLMLVGIAPASAQVNCNAGYFGTEANAVEYNGRVYRTLAGTSPFDTDFYCQNYYLALPAGWSLAEDNADSRYVIGKYRWGTSLMVIASGRSYWTLNGGYNNLKTDYLKQFSEELQVLMMNIY